MARAWHVPVAVVAVVAAALATGVTLASESPALATSSGRCPNATRCTSSWSVVKSPSKGTGANVLYGVSADSPTDAWAVGYQTPPTGGQHTLIEHWDGTAWSVVTSPNSGNDFLYAVSGDSPSDAWAVGGTTLPPTGYRKNVVEHWNGTAWSIVKVPDTKKANDDLTSVLAFASNDVVAVGTDGTQNSTVNLPLLETWNGTLWEKGNPPYPAGSHDSSLSGLGATTPTDLWAVGTSYVGSNGNPIIEHNSGGGFSLVNSPALGQSFGILGSVAAISTTDAWAVGADGNASSLTLAEHWNGTAWSTVSTPDPGVGDNELSSVAAVGSSDVWASGYADNGTVWQTLLEHWDGGAWSAVASPSPGTGYDVLWHLATSGTDGFAVGSTQAAVGSPSKTLIERACGI
jgi:hypothetical protein